MSATSTMLPLGSPAAPFSLPDTEGRLVSLDDYAGNPVLLVMFICNHCPYVKHVITGIVSLAEAYQRRGVGVVAISSNDVEAYPDDSPAAMVDFARAHHFTFPYLFDETQAVARAYRAACTPDFYVFDAGRRLRYRGQMDGARPGNGQPVTGAALRQALDALLTGAPVPTDQIASMGCSIKWRPGNEPGY